MSHNLIHHLYHIVFSTKNKAALLSSEIMEELPSYLAGIATAERCHLLKANGPADHIHLLVSIPPSIAVSDAIRSLKANSSRWISERFCLDFSWQNGYGSFTICRSIEDRVKAYIDRQEEHHKQVSFSEEMKDFADRHGLDWSGDF